MNRTSRCLLLAAILAAVLPHSAQSAAQSDRLARASDSVRKSMHKTVSLTFQAMECTEALKVLAEQSGVNFAVGPNVHGAVSLFANDMELGTALDLITEMSRNAYIAEGDVIQVMSEEEYIKATGNGFGSELILRRYPLKHISVQRGLTAIGQLGLIGGAGKILPDSTLNSLVVWDVPSTQARIAELLEQVDRPAESTRLVMPLQYAGNDSLVRRILPHLTAGIGDAELLGTGDRIALVDIPSRMQADSQLVADLDAAPKQVLMEVKILQVSYSDENSVGINWQAVQEKLNKSVQFVYPILTRTSTGAVTQGTALSAGSLKDDKFTAVVEALAVYGKTDIVSLPRILALDGKEATLHVGSNQPYVTVSTRENNGVINTYETVTMVEVGVKLNITPRIHPNGFITMKVCPEVSSVAGFEETASGGKIPVVEQSTLESVVRVKSDVYVILGGLMKKELQKTATGTPLLRRIPILGLLFGRSTVSQVKSELVIMIRPRIVAGDISEEESVPVEAGSPEGPPAK
jgi:type II secretory pathway component GspD/PulD (secretin)